MTVQSCLTLPLVEFVRDLNAVDIDEESLHLAQEIANSHGIRNLKLLKEDACALSILPKVMLGSQTRVEEPLYSLA